MKKVGVNLKNPVRVIYLDSDQEFSIQSKGKSSIELYPIESTSTYFEINAKALGQQINSAGDQNQFKYGKLPAGYYLI